MGRSRSTNRSAMLIPTAKDSGRAGRADVGSVDPPTARVLRKARSDRPDSDSRTTCFTGATILGGPAAVSPKATKLLTALAATGLAGASLAYAPASMAFDFGNMMNPSKWMGGGDRYDDYDDGPYGGPWGGPYGGGPWGGPYGGGPWGGPHGPGPYGGGAPYGYPGGYGAPPARGVAPAPAPAAPRTPSAPAAKAPPAAASSSSEIDALKRRIEELEAQARQQPEPPPPAEWGTPPSKSDWGSAPAFRPMNKQ